MTNRIKYPFIGRKKEVDTFVDFINRESKDLKHLIIRGESGVGKSFFLKRGLFNMLAGQKNDFVVSLRASTYS